MVSVQDQLASYILIGLYYRESTEKLCCKSFRAEMCLYCRAKHTTDSLLQ